jgi:hypothetical protein
MVFKILDLIDETELLIEEQGITPENLHLVFSLRLLVNAFIGTGEWESATTSLLRERITKLSSSLTELPSEQKVKSSAQSYSLRARLST